MKKAIKNWITTILGAGIIAMITYHIKEITLDVAIVGYSAGAILIVAKDSDILTIIKDLIKIKKDDSTGDI